MSTFPTGRPRPVQGGVRARTARGSIGSSWWSRRFIDALESLALGGRLGRARSYARAGQIVSFDVVPGAVTAVVQGSRPRPYRVRIAMPPFRARVWAQVERALAEQAIHSAHLLAGEMPAELEEVFAAAGAPLFPRTVNELAMRCTCPDQMVPCKHIAATLYLFAEALDRDPFQLLLWRGRPRDELLSRLRELRDPAGNRSGQAVVVPERHDAPPIGAAVALADLTDPPVAPSRFWFSPVPLPSRHRPLATDPDLLLRQLNTPGPELGGAALLDALAPAYQAFAESAPR